MERRYGKLAQPLCRAIWKVLCAISFAGFCYFNYNDIGFVSAVRKLWTLWADAVAWGGADRTGHRFLVTSASMQCIDATSFNAPKSCVGLLRFFLFHSCGKNTGSTRNEFFALFAEFRSTIENQYTVLRYSLLTMLLLLLQLAAAIVIGNHIHLLRVIDHIFIEIRRGWKIRHLRIFFRRTRVLVGLFFLQTWRCG